MESVPGVHSSTEYKHTNGDPGQSIMSNSRHIQTQSEQNQKRKSSYLQRTQNGQT